MINYVFKLNAQPKCLEFCVNARKLFCHFHIYCTENQQLVIFYINQIIVWENILSTKLIDHPESPLSATICMGHL